MEPKHIIIHHSLTVDDDVLSVGPMRDYHKSKRWKDIGYHGIIDKVDGYYETVIGRMWNETGAHCIGYNKKSLGLCLVGDFDHHPPPADQLCKAARLARYWMRLFDIPIDNVGMHRQYDPRRTCPGNKFPMHVLRKLIKHG